MDAGALDVVAADPQAVVAEPGEELDADELVEDISIDGMCGVY